MQNQINAVLLMSQAALVEFEEECLNELTYAQSKKIIKNLSRFLIDPQKLAAQIIEESKKREVQKTEPAPENTQTQEENPKP